MRRAKEGGGRLKIGVRHRSGFNFAWKNLKTQQAIIRSADLKAGYLVKWGVVFWGEARYPAGARMLPNGWEGAERLPRTLRVDNSSVPLIGFVLSMYLILGT